MRTLANRILLVMTVALCVAAAQAQSPVIMKGNVPFDFYVGDHALPAGEYTVKAIAPEVESWYDSNGRGLFVVGTIASGSLPDMNTTRMVFHRYGDQYFLAEVCGSASSHQLVASVAQQRIARKQKYETVAVLMTSHR